MNCPFCNAVLPALSAPPAADKLPCPRCGELVPAARWQVTAIAAGEPKPMPPACVSPPWPGIGNTAWIVLGIMLSMSIVGLSYALWTTKLRRSRDPKITLDPVVFSHPINLKGLGHLPKDSDIVVGLHIAEWLDDKTVGRPLLEEPRPAAFDWVMKQLPRLTGLKLEEIDHAVLAASLDVRSPQVVMVVKTRRPLDLAKIAEHAKNAEPPLFQDRALYELSLHPYGEALLWCVEDKTLFCVIRLDMPKREHLNGFSIGSRKIEDVLSAPLHTAIKERLPKPAFLWAAGRLDKIDGLKEVMPIVPMEVKAKLAAVKNLKTFALGLSPVEGLTLTGSFHMKDAQSAATFKTFLEGVKFEGAAAQKAVAPPADEPEQWVTWQVRGDVAAMRAWLDSFSARAAPRER